MRIPRIRFTVGRLMVLVALVGVVLGGVRARQHYVRCMKIAEAHEASARLDRELERINVHLTETDRVLIESAREIARIDDRLMKSLSDINWQDYLRELEEGAEAHRGRLALVRARSAYKRRMREKYRRAAYRFWERIAPDPPPPDPDKAADYWYKTRDYDRALALCADAIRSEPNGCGAFRLRAWILATCPEA